MPDMWVFRVARLEETVGWFSLAGDGALLSAGVQMAGSDPGARFRLPRGGRGEGPRPCAVPWEGPLGAGAGPVFGRGGAGQSVQSAVRIHHDVDNWGRRSGGDEEMR